MTKKLTEIKDGYYVFVFGSLHRVPKAVYKAYRSVGGTVAHAWTSKQPIDKEMILVKEEWPDLDETLDKLEAEIKKGDK